MSTNRVSTRTPSNTQGTPPLKGAGVSPGTDTHTPATHSPSPTVDPWATTFVSNNVQQISKIITSCQAAHYNLLTPPVTQVASPFRYRFELLYVNPDPAYGEVFRMGKVKLSDPRNGDRWVDKFMLAKVVLDRISMIIGVNWSPPVPGPQFIKPGFESYYQIDKEYGCYEAVGYLRAPSGEFSRVSGLKEIRLSAVQVEVEEEQITKVYSGNWKPKPGQEPLFRNKSQDQIVEILVRREMAQISKHLLALCESGARARALRSRGIKSAYLADELIHPFVIGVIELDPSNSHAKAIINKEINDLYGDSLTESLQYDDSPDPVNDSEIAADKESDALRQDNPVEMPRESPDLFRNVEQP